MDPGLADRVVLVTGGSPWLTTPGLDDVVNRKGHRDAGGRRR
jgi:hypothetical protein